MTTENILKDELSSTETASILTSGSTASISTKPTSDMTGTDLQTISEINNSPLLDLSQLNTLLDAGGPVIMLLLIMSLVSLSVVIFKCWQFFWLGIGRHKNIQVALEFWHKYQVDIALTTLKKTRSPIARVLETAITLKTRHSDDAIIREETTRIAKRELANVRSYLKVLEVIATLSPLLGLLGTVLGMITAFQKLQGAGSAIDPAILSGGIWEALLTTAAGLIVAIPTVIALNWLEQRIERLKLILEDTTTQVFTRDTQQNHNTDSKSQPHLYDTAAQSKKAQSDIAVAE